MADEENIENTKKRSAFGRSVGAFLRGDVFGSDELIKSLPYLTFLVLLGVVYIAIGYSAEDTVREINRNKAELKEMRSEYNTIKSDLMYTTIQSELAKILEKEGLELKESSRPPKKIEVTQGEWDAYKAAATDGQ